VGRIFRARYEVTGKPGTGNRFLIYSQNLNKM